MPNNTRRIQKCFHSEAETVDGRLHLKFHGRNKKGSETKHIIELDWWHFPYVVREAKESWDEERARRMREINNVDASFPTNNPA